MTRSKNTKVPKTDSHLPAATPSLAFVSEETPTSPKAKSLVARAPPPRQARNPRSKSASLEGGLGFFEGGEVWLELRKCEEELAAVDAALEGDEKKDCSLVTEADVKPRADAADSPESDGSSGIDFYNLDTWY